MWLQIRKEASSVHFEILSVHVQHFIMRYLIYLNYYWISGSLIECNSKTTPEHNSKWETEIYNIDYSIIQSNVWQTSIDARVMFLQYKCLQNTNKF